MPAKFRNKEFVSGGYYHIYNRGIDGRVIFSDENDYLFYEQLMSRYLSAEEEGLDMRFKPVKPSVAERRKEMNLMGDLELVAYCLMPDHFHLLLKQVKDGGITKFMRRLNTGYVMYYNNRHNRNGPLFENIYRGVRVDGEKQVLEMAKFIHNNPVVRVVKRFGPVETITGTRPEDYLYSSYSHYIGIKIRKWVTNVWGSFTQNEYRNWTEDPRNSLGVSIKNITIDTNE